MTAARKVGSASTSSKASARTGRSIFTRAEWLLPVASSIVLAAVVYAWAISLYGTPPVLRDAGGYTQAALRLLDRGVFAYGADPPGSLIGPNAAITPGYVLFLSGVYGATSARSADATATVLAGRPAVIGVQFVLALAVVGLVAGCGYLLGGRRLSYLAGFLAALYLPIAWSTTVSLSECLGATLVSVELLLALLVTRRDTPHPRVLVAALGAVAAALALVRPVTALWIVVPLGYLALSKHYPWKELGRLAAIALLAFALVMSGWWIRDAVTLHRFIPLSDGGGNPALLSAGGYPLTPDEQAVFDAASAKGQDPEGAVAYYRMGNQLRTAPFELIGKRLETAVVVVVTPWSVPRDALWEQTYDAATHGIGPPAFPTGQPSTTLIGAVTALAAYHMYLLTAALVSLAFVRRSPRLLLVASVPLYFVAAHSVTLFIDRYFFPAMPAVIVLAAAGTYGVVRVVARLVRRLLGGRTATAGA